MKRMLGFLGVTLLSAAAMLVGRSGTTQATGSNEMYVELYGHGEVCSALTGIRRVDVIENGNTTMTYTNSSGVARYVVSTPTDGEVLTIKYYRSSGALAGTTTATINPGGLTSDPWIFGEGANGDPCGTWSSNRTVHISFTPN